jgi:hypothetical protein
MRFTDTDLDTWADEFERTGATGAALFNDDDLDAWAGEYATAENKRLQPLRDAAAEPARVEGPGMVPQVIGKAVGNVAALGEMVPKVDVQFGQARPVEVSSREGVRAPEWEKQTAEISSMLGRGMAHTAEAAWQNGDFGQTQDELTKSYRKVRDKVAADQEFLKTREDWPEGLPEGLQSLPYSGVTMGASLLGHVAGSPLGKGGAVLGGGLASGATAYRASRHDFMGNLLMKATQELGRVPTPQEWNTLQGQFDEAATKYGAWEAIPEAVGNALFMGIVGPGSKWAAGKLGEKFGGGMLGKVASGPVGRVTTALVGTQAEEQLTEGFTTWGQGGVEADAGLRDEAPTLVEAYKESAPPTFWMTLITAGLGSGASMAGEQWKGLGRSRVLPTDDVVDLLDVVVDEAPAPKVTAPAAPAPASGVGARVNELGSQLEAMGTVPPVDEAGPGMAPPATQALPVDQEFDLSEMDAGADNVVDLVDAASVPPQGQPFTAEEIRGMMPPMAAPTVVPPMQQPVAPAPQESAGPGQDMGALIDEVADEVTMDDLMGEWDRQEAEAAGVQAPSLDEQAHGDVSGKQGSQADLDSELDRIRAGMSKTHLVSERSQLDWAIDRITATGWSFDEVVEAVATALQVGRLDIVSAAIARAKRIAANTSTVPGVSQSSPKYAAIKETLERKKREAEVQAAQLENMAKLNEGSVKFSDAVQEQTQIDEQAHQAATSPTNELPEPTRAQKEAGNYKKGHVRVHGMDISVENPRGSVRKGVDAEGRPWETEMRAHYGYIKGSVGADKDHVDVFLGDRPEGGPVYVVDQVDPATGKFDEHKVVMGAGGEDEARAIYLSNYEDGWQGLGAITEMAADEFRDWVYSKKTKKPLGEIAPAAQAAPSFKQRLQELVRTAFYDRWQEHEPRMRAAMNTLHHAGFVSEGLQQAYLAATTFEEQARVVTDFLAENGLDPRGDDLPASAAKTQPKAKGGRSEQFRRYAQWISDPKNDVGQGLAEEIARDERLEDGEAEALKRMIAQRKTAGGAAKGSMVGKWVRSGSVSGQVTEELADGRLMVGSSTVTPGQAPNWAVQDAPFDDVKKPGGQDDAPPEAEEEVPGYGTMAKPDTVALAKHFAAQLRKGVRYSNIGQARTEAAKLLGVRVEPGTPLVKAVDEAMELGVVMTARRQVVEMRQAGATDAEIFEDLVALYNQQPNLASRTSTSIAQQAYSTPAPIAFLASRLAGIGKETHVLEPTAGNGMLLLEADPRQAVVNELNEDRAERLRAQGFTVTEVDAAESGLARSRVDAVIANPPFGRVRDNSGGSKSWSVLGHETKELDHAVVLNALAALKKDGRAVLIIGGKQGSDATRKQKYQATAQRAFYATLYENFNVVDHFSVSGDLYARQGAGYPIDIIVIEGRGATPDPVWPAARLPRVYESFDALKELFHDHPSLGARDGVRGDDAADAGGLDGDRRQGKPAGAGGNQAAGALGGGRSTEQGGGVSAAGVGEQWPGRSGVRSDEAGAGGSGRDLSDDAESGAADEANGSSRREPGGISSDADTDSGPRIEPGGLGERGGDDLTIDEIMGEWDRQDAAANEDVKPEPEERPAKKSRPKKLRFPTPEQDEERSRILYDLYHWQREKPKSNYDKAYKARKIAELEKQLRKIPEGSLEMSFMPYITHYGLEKSGQKILGLRLVEIYREGAHLWIDHAFEIGMPEKAYDLYVESFAKDKAGPVFTKSYFDKVVSERLAAEKATRKAAEKAETPARRPTRAPKEEAQKPATKSIKDSAAELKQNLSAAMDALSKFGGLSVREVKDGDDLNLDAYNAAKPHMLAALQNLKDMGYAGAELARELVARVRAMFGAQAAKARPYFEKFAREEVLGQKPEKKAVAPAKPASAKASATALQLPYEPRSNGASMGTLVPRNMATPLQTALADLESRRGDLDTWVAGELGYSEEELFGYFAGEQVDAIALALDNIEKGAGFIIGDQTGIGKGRVNAAIIRYAARQGLVPVFVTMKPDLYADMIRDLQDIGMSDFSALPTNSGLTGDKAIPLPGGQVMRTGSKHDEILSIALETDMNHGGWQAVFTTYDQLNTVRGKDTFRREFLRKLAPRALFILDESHNAGGQEKNDRKKKDAAPSRAEFVRALLHDNPHGTFYSSATYAKRPDVMSLYHKTDMRHAVDDIGKLASAIEAGGIPLQQVVAAMLTASGQYVRRERSFEGASVEVSQHPADQASAEMAATIMRGILEFDVLKKAAMAEIKEAAAAAGGAVGDSSAVGQKGAGSTNFTSVMHNLIGQSLLAMKAGAAVDEALAALERGEKPIITLANTMGSFIKDYVEEHGIPVRGELDLTFRDLFLRYLDKTRTLTRKDPRGKVLERRMLTDAELGPAGAAMYRQVKRMIEQSSFGDMPISPIDFITSQLEQKGVRVGEITGRTHAVSYEDGAVKYRTRTSSPAQNIETVRKFNAGEIDVVILNQSGSTGISLHSSEKFADRRKRTMIIAQPELNIDVFMQTLGRVFRTGQVVPPAYKLLVIDLPAEKRPAAVLGKKMAGLNANTTASRKADTTFSNIPDFLNQYGDMVMAQLMEEDPQLHASLGHPLSNSDKGGLKREDAVRIVTGRIPILPLVQQVELYERLESEYTELMASLEASGQSALEAKTLALDAKAVSTEELTAAKDVGSASPFAGASHLGVFDVKMLGKPYTSEQVRALVDRGKESVPDLDAVIDEARDWVEEKKKALVNDEARAALEDRVGENLQVVRRIYTTFPVGSTLVGWIGDDNFYGVVTRVERRGKGNPLAPSSWKLTIAVDAPYKQLVVPFSKVYSRTQGEIPLGGIVLDRSGALDAVLGRFDAGQRVAREKRVIAYGNILAAYAAVGNKGQVVNFEDSDGDVRPGILFGRDVSVAQVLGGAAVSLPDASSVFELFSQTGDKAVVKSADSNLIITQEGGRVKFVTPLAKARGAQFYFNGKLIEAGGGEFVKVGNMMVRKVDTAAAWRMIEALREQGFGLVAATHLDEARAIIARRKDGGAARMSLGAGPVKGMRASRVRGIVTAVSRDWAMAPKVEVVQRVDDLPAPLLNEVRRKGAQDAVEGVYHDGTIYIVADRMTSANHVFLTVLHEAAGHHGLRLVMGERELTRALDAAWKNKRVQKAAEEIADVYELDLGDLEQRREAVEEVLAHWAESGADERALDRFVAAVLRALRRVFSGVALSDAEVRDLIVRSRRAVEEGRVGRGGGSGVNRFKRGANQVAATIGSLGQAMTPAQVAAELENNRTFANKIHEGRDLVRHQVRVTAVDMQREVQRLAGSKKWKYNPLKVFSSEKELKDSAKSRLLDAAMMVYRELQINPDKAQEFRDWARAQLVTARGRERLRILEQLRVLDAAEHLSDEQRRFVDDVMDDAFSVVGRQATSAGIVATLLDNYVRRLWNRPQDGDKAVFSGAGHAFKTFTTASKQRTLETVFDGWMKGYDLQVKGITSSWASIAGEVGEIVANKMFIQEGRRSGILSTRQKPGFSPLRAKGLHVWARKAGVKIRMDEVHGLLGKDGNGRNLFVAPPRRYFAVYLGLSSKRAKALFDREQDAEALLLQLHDQGHVDAWMEFRQDVDIFERVPLYAPAQVADLINRMTRSMDGDSAWKAPLPRTILQFNNAAKAWILMTSFFHHLAGARSWAFGVNHGVMEAVRRGDLREAVSRAAKGLNPVSAHKRGLEKIKSNNAVLRELIRHGLVLGEMADWSEGILSEHRGLTERLFTLMSGRVPGAERAVAMVQAGKLFREKAANSLFKRLFAGLKAEAACVEFAHQMKQEIAAANKAGRVPNAKLVAERVARLINSDFGGLHLARMGRMPGVQAALRLLLLAPDWTESNWRTVTGTIPGLNKAVARAMREVPGPPGMDKVFRRFWGGIILKGAASTLLLQIAVTSIFGDDDDDWRDMYREQFADWDTFRRMRWTGVDVTPIYKRLGVDVPKDERKIFSVVGHFADFLRMMDPESLIKGKFSPVMRVAGSLGTKTDYRQRPYTGFAELLETGKTIKKSYHQPTETFFSALPSIVLAQARDIQPIQLGYLLKYIQGEEDGLTALLSSAGAHMKAAYAPDLVGKAFDSAGTEINATYRRMKELRELVRVHAAMRKSDPEGAAKLKEQRAEDFAEAESFLGDKGAVLRVRENYEAYQDVLRGMRKQRRVVDAYQMNDERRAADVDSIDGNMDALKKEFLETYWRNAK